MTLSLRRMGKPVSTRCWRTPWVVKQMIVAVNKVDDKTVMYKQERYEEIKKEVSAYLKKVSFL